MTGSAAGWSVASGSGEWLVDSGGLPLKTGALQAVPHHSLFSVKGIGPAVLGMAQTGPAEAGELHDGADEPERGGGVEEEGRPGHWTAVTGMGTALVNVALSNFGSLEEGHCRQDSAVH